MNTTRLYVYYLFTLLMPFTRMFAVKRVLLRWAGGSIGKNVRIASSARFAISGSLAIGDNTWIGHDVLITGGDSEIKIGSNVDIAPRVTLISGTHHKYTVLGKAAGEGYSLPIVIEDGAWIGVSSTILGGVVVGHESIIAAGALVQRSVLPLQTVAGVPAKTLKRN